MVDYAGVEGESKAQTVRGRRTTRRRGRTSDQKCSAAGVGSKQHPIHANTGRKPLHLHTSNDILVQHCAKNFMLCFWVLFIVFGAL